MDAHFESRVSPRCDLAKLSFVGVQGEALFDLGQLLRYRNGQHSPLPALQRIPDEHIRKMVLHMINPEAAARHVYYLWSLPSIPAQAVTVFPASLMWIGLHVQAAGAGVLDGVWRADLPGVLLAAVAQLLR